MARSEIVTIIPLDTAARIIGNDPIHFNSIETTRRPITNACDDIWFQYAWQRTGQASRDDLALALREAEDMTIDYLGYSPVPIWVEAEEKLVEHPSVVELQGWGLNSRGQAKSVQSNLGFVIEAGVRAKSLVQASAPIVYSDEDGDGYNETATVTVATSLTEAQEIHAYFEGKSGDDSWEIRPIDITLSGGNAILVFPRYLVPTPTLWDQDPIEQDIWRPINGDNIANFETAIDVYRVYNDPSDQATFYNRNACSSCNGSGCANCDWSTETGCLYVRDSRLGLLAWQRADWNTGTLQFDPASFCCGEPEKMTISYRAGTINRRMKYPYIQIDPMWARAIVYFAYTRLDRQDSRCENTQNVWSYWTQDLAKVEQSLSFSISVKDLQNPLGTTRAAIQLWRMIERHRLVSR